MKYLVPIIKIWAGGEQELLLKFDPELKPVVTVEKEPNLLEWVLIRIVNFINGH